MNVLNGSFDEGTRPNYVELLNKLLNEISRIIFKITIPLQLQSPVSFSKVKCEQYELHICNSMPSRASEQVSEQQRDHIISYRESIMLGRILPLHHRNLLESQWHQI